MADVAAQFVELNGALKRENYAKAVEICNKSASVVINECEWCVRVCGGTNSERL